MKNHESKLRKLYIECGTTLRSPVNSGIQRVVRNITGLSGHIAPQFGFDCMLVDFNGSFFAPAAHGVINTTPEVSARDSVFALKILIAVHRILRKISIFGIYNNIYNKYRGQILQWLVPDLKTQDRVVFQSGVSDSNPPVLLLLDSTWTNAIWAQTDEFRNNGGLVCAVLYDMIPFTHPGTVLESTRIAHTGWWERVPQHVDAIMCISQSVRLEYLSWQEKQKLPHPLPPEKVGYFYLGAEVAMADPVVRLLTEHDPYFLMVGSLEPRKDHKTVLDAFEQLWAQGVNARIAFVGAFGWRSEELLARINNHPQLNRQLFLIRDSSDRDLAGLYCKTTALIIASLAEGFGLPIVEASQYRARVICSDIPVFREVAGQSAIYFGVQDSNSLADRILDCLRENMHSDTIPARVSQSWMNWRECTEQLLDKLSRFEK